MFWPLVSLFNHHTPLVIVLVRVATSFNHQPALMVGTSSPLQNDPTFMIRPACSLQHDPALMPWLFPPLQHQAALMAPPFALLQNHHPFMLWPIALLRHNNALMAVLMAVLMLVLMVVTLLFNHQPALVLWGAAPLQDHPSFVVQSLALLLDDDHPLLVGPIALLQHDNALVLGLSLDDDSTVALVGSFKSQTHRRGGQESKQGEFHYFIMVICEIILDLKMRQLLSVNKTGNSGLNGYLGRGGIKLWESESTGYQKLIKTLTNKPISYQKTSWLHKHLQNTHLLSKNQPKVIGYDLLRSHSGDHHFFNQEAALMEQVDSVGHSKIHSIQVLVGVLQLQAQSTGGQECTQKSSVGKFHRS